MEALFEAPAKVGDLFETETQRGFFHAKAGLQKIVGFGHPDRGNEPAKIHLKLLQDESLHVPHGVAAAGAQFPRGITRFHDEGFPVRDMLEGNSRARDLAVEGVRVIR
jgi:hypothetical protein